MENIGFKRIIYICIGVILLCTGFYVFGCTQGVKQNRAEPDRLAEQLVRSEGLINDVIGGISGVQASIGRSIEGIEASLGYSSATVDSTEKLRILIGEMENQYNNSRLYNDYLNRLVGYLVGEVELPEIPEYWNWQDEYYRKWDEELFN